MSERNYDLNAWLESYKSGVSSFSKIQQDSFKALERDRKSVV